MVAVGRGECYTWPKTVAQAIVTEGYAVVGLDNPTRHTFLPRTVCKRNRVQVPSARRAAVTTATVSRPFEADLLFTLQVK